MTQPLTAVSIPAKWERRGLMLPRNSEGFGTLIIGDPCIVFDDELGGWRMFVFALPPGHAHAACTGDDPLAPGAWRFEGPLAFENPADIAGGVGFKPWVVMDACHPNMPAKINGRYCLVFGTGFEARQVQQAWADSLSGPWEVDPDPLIPRGNGGEFDAKHAEAPTAFWFAEREQLLCYYMAHPAEVQPGRASPLGAAQAVAVQTGGEGQAEKLGVVLPPSDKPGHWTSGWVGGLQLLPGREHRWVAIANASPTRPDPESPLISMREEPPPSLGGFAVCDEEWPVAGWRWEPEPIEWIEAIPNEAEAAGEVCNLWRHHILVMAGGELGLFYNTGEYGQEQIYAKVPTL